MTPRQQYDSTRERLVNHRGWRVTDESYPGMLSFDAHRTQADGVTHHLTVNYKQDTDRFWVTRTTVDRRPLHTADDVAALIEQANRSTPTPTQKATTHEIR